MPDTTQIEVPDKTVAMQAEIDALKAELNKPGVMSVVGSGLAKWHPIIVGAAVAVVPPLLNYLGTVNWQTIGVSPSAAVFIGALIMVLRSTTLKVNT